MTAQSGKTAAAARKTIITDEPYTIFSLWKKRWIVLLASVAAFFAPFSVNSYFPAMNKVEMDLNITSQQVNLSVTVFMIWQALSPSFWSSLADTRGRRPVYIATLLIYILACAGLALVTNYTLLLVFRMLQAFGAASVIAIGAGTIADVTHPAERGGYIGWYSLGWNLGPVIGPAVGGVVSQYMGWRWIFWFLAIFGGAHWILLGFCLPETLRSLVGNGSGYANPTPIQWWRHRQEQKNKTQQQIDEEKRQSTATFASRKKKKTKSWTQWFLGPVQPLLYAKEKDILLLLVYYSVQYASCYAVTTSVPFLFSKLYNLNEVMLGFSYFPNGIGCIVGSIVQGKILNRDYQRMRRRSSTMPSTTQHIDLDLPIEHARMRTVWIHSLIFNILLVVYGWCLYVGAHIAIALSIQFFLGFTSQAIFNAIQTLLVDLYPTRSASITASNNIFRCLAGALATTVVLPALQLLDAGWTFTIASGILLVSRIPLYFELKHGPRWRRERAERLAAQQQK
ncbi:major facilitator superfamily domain-containing protein [Zychaea mexicana]|uniref:major facilitator superfamily domain-containing protein n=1 Tax=Zychaea mexicana TaxID=64656 RepID=UPI0022FF2E13|nr:major facilitator superfamily domain-containing protein [Zychaea mexicana]KAI9490879.1 major facilitator superfamily domain-containing protein [Zychaea mexicana]